MNRDLMLRAGKYKKRRKLRHLWKRIVSALGCVVVFCTTYALILPAVTQERESFCGIEAHTHTQECLVQGTEIDHYELMCSYETLGVHQHDDNACYDEQKNLICTELDYLIHVHNEACYRADGKFTCMLPEIPPHEHTQECYQLLGGHVHSEECHAFTRGALICTLPEEEPHTHQEGCWILGEQLLCGVESEHVHSSECYAASSEYVCGYGQEHLHTETCYGPGTQLLCTAEEQHVHADECYISSQEITCGFEQEHTHNEGCYSVSRICAVPENHFHQASCYAPADLICADASEEHQHADSCYGEPVLLCTTPEGHVHSEQCFEQVLSCQITEHIHADCYAAPELACSKAENHTHTASCYEQILLCQEAEHVHTDACLAAPELLCTLSHVHTDDCREKLLQCKLAETAGHRHTDACYEQQIEWVCTLEETPGTETLVCEQPDVPVHIHSDSCYMPIYKYEVVCTLPEHTHQLSCYSDPTADVETERDWEKSFKHVTLTGVWEADVLAIAESQLGYHESTRNYIVLEDGVSTRGYTRYGAWYRAPYGDWCAMFASFCLHYAQVEGMPLEANCQNWIEALSEPDVNLYHPVGTYTPKPGDLVFFEYDDDNNSDHVGIVVEYKEQLKTIEGNSAEVVRKVTYDLDDPTIIGYGAIPELLNQAADDEALPVVYYCGVEEHLHGEECSDAEGNFICTLTEHQHGEECLIKPEETPETVVYYCGSEEHLHGEACSDAEGNFICIAAEHQHSEECLIKPEETPAPVVYYCGVEEHLHGEACSDAEGNFICIEAEHQHSEECLIKPEETPAPVVYYCGVEEHLHGEACSDAEGNFICIAAEHQHGEECLIKPEETPETVVYYCGVEEHLHGEACSDAEGNFICIAAEHQHGEECLVKPEETPETVVYYCGVEEHLHGEACSDAEGNFICIAVEHQHGEECLVKPEETLAPVVYYCGVEEHLHGEACSDAEGNFICVITEHTHGDSCLVEPTPIVYYCGMDEHIHSESCVDTDGTLICVAAEHVHGDECLIKPEETPAPVTYYCGTEEHLHGEACLDSEGNFICTLTEHTHDDTCLIEPAPITYHCGMEEHLHGEACLDSEGNFICTLTEHTHDDTCLIEPAPVTYHCGMEEHLHGEACLDSEGNFICTLTEHTHDDTCLTEPAPITYHCGMEEHLHGETCLDSEGNFICTLTEHTHDDTCLIEPAPITYHCGMEEHLHGENCLDGEGNFICTLTEHTHDDTCLIAIVYYCGMEEHLHGEACLDSEGNFICTLTEHTHNEGCLLKPKNAYFCGSEEHAHTETCYGESGELICTLEEHTHTLVCAIDLSPFTQDVGRQICEVTVMIDKLLTIDQIEEKIQEYESVGDYEGEEAWMTELYQQVQNTYRCYALLPAEAQEAIPNRDKLLEMEFIWSIMPLAETLVGYAIPYGPEYFTATGKFVFYTQGASGQYYAFDQNGNAIPVSVDENGVITISSDNEETLLWTLTGNGSNHFIQSVSNSRYMHAYPHSGSSVTTSGQNASVLEPVGTGLRVRSNSEYAYLDEASRIFRVTSDVNNAAVYNLGVIYNNHVWLDGTNGGLMGLYGSPDKAYPSASPTFILPTYWESPTKYAYTLRGWYDVINGVYYAPGAPVTVTSNMVFYADWVAETYNIGEYNAHTADTISTNEFITVRVFDYSSMFNTLSTTAEVTVSADSHSEVWSMADDKEGSPGFIFRDWDRGSRDISYPANLTAVNNNGDVYQGLLTAQRRDLLFNPDTSFNPYTGEGVLGKQYLGKADHLFQYGESPSDGENYGYYYYDSHYNAASFHKDHGRFYVYDYLERTSDSQTSHSDFLPFNSPYANTNGKAVSTYSYEGINGEYAGTTHYMYDAKDTGNGSDPSHVATNYWFGISMNMDFYLPNTPGTVDAEGNPANQSVQGDNMVFEFSGDDDVWVLIDGQVVLDLGGIHGDEFGSINFTTGEVIVNGANDGNVTYLEPGSHTLTMYYLERGSSMSNCKIRFNLSPRYSLSLQKEDVLTRDLLNGAKFAIYTDAECTSPAQLWTSQASHDRGEAPRHEFTVANGKAVMWGLSAGTTYYMKEIQPPENREETVHGIVVMTLNNQGQASYSVIADHGELSGGFTVHGYRIDQETQEAYLVITNAENVTETTDLFVRKKWNDSANHSGDSVTVYLMVDGTVIREAELSAANDWTYVWSNMPKYLADGVTPVPYVVREGTVPGYIGQVESITETGQMITTWVETNQFVNRETYLLSSFQGYLAAANDEIYFISNQADAADEPAAQWDVTVYSGGIVLQNKLGLTLFYKGWPTYRFVARARTSGSTTQINFSNGIFRSGNSYMCNDAGDGTLNASDSSNAVRYTLHQRTEVPEVLPEGTTGYLIVNTPVEENDTLFLTVKKEWDLGLMGTTSMYEQLTVNVRLLANGSDSGMRGQLSLRNGWTTTFSNLPKKDNAGNSITYTVEEMDVPGIWSPHYGEIVPVEGVANTYTTTITNVNTLTYMLPETGGSGTIWYTLGGTALILTALALLGYKISSARRKEEYHSS